MIQFRFAGFLKEATRVLAVSIDLVILVSYLVVQLFIRALRILVVVQRCGKTHAVCLHLLQGFTSIHPADEILIGAHGALGTRARHRATFLAPAHFLPSDLLERESATEQNSVHADTFMVVDVEPRQIKDTILRSIVAVAVLVLRVVGVAHLVTLLHDVVQTNVVKVLCFEVLRLQIKIA